MLYCPSKGVFMGRSFRILCLLIVLQVIFLSGFKPGSEACTIWASAGNTVEGGGTIVGKNRDNISSLYSGLKLVFPLKGFRFFGILDVRENGYVTAAINEKGLVVVNASPNSVPGRKRHVATEDVTEKIVVAFDSVDSLIAQKDFFEKTHPAIYIIADVSKIMSVEVAPGGRVSTNVKMEGSLALTNHYIDESIADANEWMSRKSLLRLKKINALLAETGRLHSMDGFIGMSLHEGDDLDGAIMRKAQKGTKIRTLATWIVRLEPGKSPELFVSLLNPQEKLRTYRVLLDDNFWSLVYKENGE